jgi:hypothetical protein
MKEINISYVYKLLDRYWHTFNVEYEDPQGVKHTTSCEMRVWGSTIHWKDR